MHQMRAQIRQVRARLNSGDDVMACKTALLGAAKKAAGSGTPVESLQDGGGQRLEAAAAGAARFGPSRRSKGDTQRFAGLGGAAGL